jgi:hypothetical protein
LSERGIRKERIEDYRKLDNRRRYAAAASKAVLSEGGNKEIAGSISERGAAVIVGVDAGEASGVVSGVAAGVIKGEGVFEVLLVLGWFSVFVWVVFVVVSS